LKVEEQMPRWFYIPNLPSEFLTGVFANCRRSSF
jgi:hypothetical protein